MAKGQAARAYSNIDVDETGVLAVARGCTLVGYYIYNAASSVRYVRLYDKSVAPTVGTTTAAMVLPIPATSGANAFLEAGICDFTKGLGVGASTGVAASDTGAPSANDVQVNLFWKPL